MSSITTSTNSLGPALLATIACIFLMVLVGIASFVFWPFIFYVSKLGLAQDIDDATAKDTLKIIEAAKSKGEKSVTIHQTIPSGGLLIDLPLTKTYKVKFDD